MLPAIKESVDEDTRPGRLLLTGSPNALTVPRVADSLTGRMETIRLLPLSRTEIFGRLSTSLARLLAGTLQSDRQAVLGDDLMQLVLIGAFPEVSSRDSERRCQDWARSCLISILTRDLRDIAEIERLTEPPRFARLLGEYSARLINHSQLGAGMGVGYKTSRRYTALLEQLFLVATLPPWYANTLKRITKTPKPHFLDSGVLVTARGFTPARLKGNRDAFGSTARKLRLPQDLKARGGVRFAAYAPSFSRPSDAKSISCWSDDGLIAAIKVIAGATNM